MSKEVSITLKASLDDIPEEAAELLEVLVLKLSAELDNLKVITNNLVKSKNMSDHGHCLVDMGSFRRGLYKIDSRMEDVMGILAGYQRHMTVPAQQPTPPDEEEIVANYD